MTRELLAPGEGFRQRGTMKILCFRVQLYATERMRNREGSAMATIILRRVNMACSSWPALERASIGGV